MKRDYEQVAALLDACGVESSAAEFHGIVCGQVSSGPGALRLDLAARLLGIDQALPPAIEELILRFAGEIAAQLGSGDFAFQPLLPADEADLERRVLCLGRWCEGFNMGFAAGHVGGSGELPAETREVISDFSRIAQLEDGIELSGSGEQDESDYTEILEYVRMAAASVFMQNVPARVATQPGPDEPIH